MFTRLFAFLSRWLESSLTYRHQYEPTFAHAPSYYRPQFRPNGTHGSTRRRNRHRTG
jgi:hypothetical protein